MLSANDPESKQPNGAASAPATGGLPHVMSEAGLAAAAAAAALADDDDALPLVASASHDSLSSLANGAMNAPLKHAETITTRLRMFACCSIDAR